MGMHHTSANSVSELLGLAVTARRSREPEMEIRIMTLLGALDRFEVSRVVEREGLQWIDTAWRLGWQPREVARQIRRTTDASTARMALVAIAADHAQRSAATLDGRWVAQLTALDLPPVAPSASWFAEWQQHEQLAWPEQLRCAVALLQNLAPLTRIPTLIPPPGQQTGHTEIIDLTTKTNDPVLDRIRALLALAESTQFEAEAETFTAKAQQLMARHAIDMAMISAGNQSGERPGTIRIATDEPYVDAKSLLLHVVAESSRCQAVFHERYAMSSVVGFASDLDATETLFTSLLVQAQVAMRAASTSAVPGTRARSRSFRSAFLMAYAHRVAERLEEINDYVVADAEAQTGRSILPVLAARSSLVDDAVGEMFGSLARSKIRRGLDAAGWASGRMAADRARLSSGDLDEPHPKPGNVKAIVA
jgi:hypothetical protein